MATKKGGFLSYVETPKPLDEASSSEGMSSDKEGAELQSNADDTNGLS